MRIYSNKQKIFFTILIFVLGFLLPALLSYLAHSQKISVLNKKSQNQLSASVNQSVANSEENTEPKYYYSNKDWDKKIKISAKSYIVGDLKTGEIILGKDETQVYPIASISKLMTAVVADEISKGDEVAKVSKRALNTVGENGNFKLNEKVKITDLYYPLLIESSNDAAEIFAENFGRESFLSKMNLEAEKIKMTSTHFDDPSGLSSENTSSAEDLFKLTGYVYQSKPDILKITTKKSYNNKKHAWYSNNQFLREKGYTGGKSGTSPFAKQAVVSTFNLHLGENVDRPVGIVLLQSNDRVGDVKKIVQYLNKNVYFGGPADAKADWIKERLNLPDIREPDFLTLVFGGDIMLDRGVKNSVIKNFNNDYSFLFDKLNIVREADIAFANLEGPASDKGTDSGNLYSFRMAPETIPALKSAGFSVLSVANNHVGDFGRVAYADTLARLTENEIAYTGGGILDTAKNPTIIEKYGFKIGFLGFTDVGPNNMKAEEQSEGVLLASDPDYEKIIADASRQVDYLVVSLHFGTEYTNKHNKRQESLAHSAIDNGAKFVIGHHPHVVEDTEVYKNGFIAYSLGNLIFDQNFRTDTMAGMLLKIKLAHDGTFSIQKNTVKLNKVFQPSQVILGKEEKIKK